MTTLPHNTPRMVHISTSVAIERADTRHIVPRSGLKRLGYTAQQRAQLRAIKAELKQ
jgi:hypothetical protein